MKRQRDEDIWEKIKEAQKDPEFIRAVYEFIRFHTGSKKWSIAERLKYPKIMKHPMPKAKKDICNQILEWQKDPEFIRAAYEFILYHTGHRKADTKSG